MLEKNKDIFNLKDLEVNARKFALKLNKGSLVLLKGDLGAGKTTFIRFIINSLFEINKLNKPVQINSPSFPILLTYDLKKYEIYHYDFYRIQNLSELGINIPRGFALTVDAYWDFIKHNKLNSKIKEFPPHHLILQHLT